MHGAFTTHADTPCLSGFGRQVSSADGSTTGNVMRGACLCGAVRFAAEPSEMHSHACHCEMCRRWSGSAFLAVPVREDAIRLEGEDSVRRFSSSDWAERAFCGVCGSALFYRLKDGGDLYVALGLFDEPDALPLTSEIYIDRKPGAYAFAGERKRLTKAEVEASFAGGGA